VAATAVVGTVMAEISGTVDDGNLSLAVDATESDATTVEPLLFTGADSSSIGVYVTIMTE